MIVSKRPGRRVDWLEGETGTATDRVQFGCGDNRLQGWLNCDREVNIAKALPFADGSVSFVFAEHVIEHVTHLQGIAFLREVLRILKPGGVLRVAFPDVTRINHYNCKPFLQKPELKRERGVRDVWEAIMTHWGHQACWTRESMGCALLAVGFEFTENATYGRSRHAELNGIDGHHLSVGEEVARLQTTILEACKAG